MSESLQEVRELAAELRIDSIRSTTTAGSGHPTSSMSAADLMAVLMSRYLRYSWEKPHDPHNDRLIFSKGHACPLLYAMYRAAGAITDAEQMTLRKKALTTQEVANAAVFLLSDRSSGINAQGVPLDAGMSVNYFDKGMVKKAMRTE